MATHAHSTRTLYTVCLEMEREEITVLREHFKSVTGMPEKLRDEMYRAFVVSETTVGKS